MSLHHSPKIVTDGLVFHVDGGNRKSYIKTVKTSTIDTEAWTVSSGSIGIYGQNGSTDENVRLYDTDPWGNQSIVWETRANGSAADDGGWNSSYMSIDNTKLYRFSVWVRRTTSTGGGTFYFGTGATGGEVRNISTGATAGNPYWHCGSPSSLTQNQWYLVCGHIQPFDTKVTTQHPETGFYTVAGGNTVVFGINQCNIGPDLKWDAASVTATHRTYHYYCADSTTRLQFAWPRMDKCDGTQPSISELLGKGPSKLYDLTGNYQCNFLNTVAYNNGLVFNGVDSGIDLNTSSLITGTNPFTIEIFYNNSGSTSGALFGNYGPGNSSGTIWIYSGGIFLNGNFYITNPNPRTFGTGPHCITITRSAAGNLNSYLDGVFDVSATNTASVVVGQNWRIGKDVNGNTVEPFNGTIHSVKVYNKVLTAAEVSSNFNAQRSRYGI